MSNAEEKVSKSNGLGLGIDPMQRLASIKPPRDFTLGAAKAKKVFTPNLNVSRNKNKGPTISGSRENKDDKSRRERKNDKNRNNRHGPEIIRSGGVFAEGLGKGAPRVSSRFQDQDRSPVVLQRPMIKVKDVFKIDKELEDQKIRAVTQQGNFTEEEVEDFQYSSEIDAPVRIPMDDISWSMKPKPMVKQEIQIKTEPVDEDEPVEKKPVPFVKKEFFEETDVVDLLRSDQPVLIMLKFPDALPGRVGNGDEGPRRKQAQPATSDAPEQGETQASTRCNLKGLEEGRIGKLKVHRSGRVMLHLGESVFEVIVPGKPAYHQELVSVSADPSSRSASATALGPVCHKLTAVPDWERMFTAGS